MTKQAYMRGLTKKAANTDFLTSYDDRWSRAGIVGLATLLGSKALGAGWGTAGTLATILGTGAYNTHNIANAMNKVKALSGEGKKEQAPKPDQKPKRQPTEAEKQFQRMLENEFAGVKSQNEAQRAPQRLRDSMAKAKADQLRKRQLNRKLKQALDQDLTDYSSGITLMDRAATEQDAARARNKKQQRWAKMQPIIKDMQKAIQASGSPEQATLAARKAYYTLRQLGYYKDAVTALQPLVDKYNKDNGKTHNVITLAGYDSDYATKYNQAVKQDYDAFLADLNDAQNNNFQVPQPVIKQFWQYQTPLPQAPRTSQPSKRYPTASALYNDIMSRVLYAR